MVKLLPLAPLALALALLCTPAPAAAPPPQKHSGLDATLRALEADIAAVRGLRFKRRVVARVIRRPKGGPRGIQGYYSTKQKVLYLYNDVRGNYARGVLIHEMVHALQDQHFGLAKLHATAYGSDAELARAALVEGDATLTMIELLRKEQPAAARMLDVPLAKAKNLQNAFLYAQGARYVQALKRRGGWPAVNFAYRFPPGSTAEVLHPEGVTTINLGPGKTVGEYGLMALLAAHPASASEAVPAAAGWRGDRLIEAGPGRAWVVAFATPAQAERFAAALAATAQGLKRLHRRPGEEVWRGRKGVRGIVVRGSRVLELRALDEKAYRALREKVEGPLQLSIYSAQEKRVLTFGELTDRLMTADIVCVGETHDSELHHRVQLEIIKALYARDERLGVGMEMFQRPYQKALDRYLAGSIREQVLLEDSEYRQRWGFDWSLYRPIVDFCRRNGLPVAALNVPRELTRRLSRVGFAGLSAAEKEQLGAIDFHVKEHRDYWFERLAKMHGKSGASAGQKERSYQVMTAWDEYMADSAARFQKERRLRRLVVLAGSGHIERGFGIPQRAARRTGGKVLTVRVALGAEAKKVEADPAADFVVVVR
jgi:uncharacterized iron-regulated protein